MCHYFFLGKLLLLMMAALSFLVQIEQSWADKIELATDGSEILIQGGAPYDPKTCPPVTLPGESVPFEAKPEYSNEINNHLKNIMAMRTVQNYNTTSLDLFTTSLRHMLEVQDGGRKILERETHNAVCQVANWGQFTYSMTNSSPPYSHPYMSTARFKCGKVDVAITSSCAGPGYGGCYMHRAGESKYSSGR